MRGCRRQRDHAMLLRAQLHHLGTAHATVVAGQSTIGRSVMMAKDPICGMDVDERTAKHTAEYQGQTYYFCAPGCKRAFEQDPQQYVGTQAKPS
jgi:YHS domain-containing protein